MSLFYHGSYQKLTEKSSIIKIQNGYTEEAEAEFENLVNSLKPKHLISRTKALFICDDIENLDDAGAYTDFIYEVEPIGQIDKSDLAWYSEAYCLFSDNVDIFLIKEYILNYWNGVTFFNKEQSLFEFRCKEFKILKEIIF